MLATNQQGQTYLVAQQQPQPAVNQILLTQTSQQQGGAPTKTIIILQQQTPTAVNTGKQKKKRKNTRPMLLIGLHCYCVFFFDHFVLFNRIEQHPLHKK